MSAGKSPFAGYDDGTAPKKRGHPEDDIQRAVAQVLDTLGVLWCHVPNGGKRNAREAARFKALGVKAGVLDILIFTPPPVIPKAIGAALELKAGYGRPSEAQLWWMAELRRLGWDAQWTQGIEGAIGQLKAWGYLR